MTEDLFARLGAWADASEREVGLEARHTGASLRGRLDVPPGWEVAPQGGGDLGDRLFRALQDAFDRSAAPERPVAWAAVGADVPTLPPALLDAALAAVSSPDPSRASRQARKADAAVIPAEDGGYVLIAAGSHLPEKLLQPLFRNIPWGGPEVLEETRRIARDAGLELAETPPHWDVDRPADLQRLAAAIASAEDDGALPRTETVLAACGLLR